MEILVSLSALPPSLYRKYVKGWRPNPVLLKLFEKLSGKRGTKAMRIYIDAKTDQVIKNIAQQVEVPEIVAKALSEKKIEVVDYIAGTGKDTHGRVVRIGRALKDPVVKKAFDSDPNRKSLTNATKNHQLICISMHPYDIAGMSTDRGWSSCMNLKGGSNKKFVKQDVTSGTLIAYLIDPQDKNINKPIARALAKPYFERIKRGSGKKQVVGDVNALYLVDFAYPDSTMPFVHVLQEWFDEHINPNIATTKRNGMYYLKDKLYADKRSVLHHYDLSSALAGGRYDEFAEGVMSEQNNKAIDPTALKTIIVDGVVDHPKALIPLYLSGYRNVSAYADIVRQLASDKQDKAVVDFIAALYADPNANSIIKNKTVTPAVMTNKDIIPKLLQLMPDKERDQRAEAILESGDAYNSNSSSLLNGGFPAALSQVWQLAQMLPDSEQKFWHYAESINAHGTGVEDIAYEYSDVRFWTHHVLGNAVGSLFMRQGDCPATLASLKRHKKILHPDYYECAEAVFNGAVFVSLSAREAKDGIVARFAKDTGVNEVFASRAVFGINFDYDLVDQEAVEALNLEVVYDFTPRYAENVLLVNSDKTWQEIRAEFMQHAEEFAQQQLQEYLDEQMDRLKRGKTSYNPMVAHVEEPEEDEDDDIPDMSGDEDFDADEEHNWQEENEVVDDEDEEDEDDEGFDDYLEEGEFDRPLTPDHLERLLLQGRQEATVVPGSAEDVYSDLDPDDGAPIMDDDEEDDEESERLYAQHMARVRAAKA